MRPSFALAIVFFSLAILPGCGKDNPLGRLPVSGTVTFQGKPLDQGSIEFAPVDPLGKTKAGASITEGRYSIETDQGLAPGTYIVRIFSSEGGAGAAKDAMPGTRPTAIPRERIPAVYNVNSRLQCEVSQSGENVHDFTL